ncbi:C6 finger domain protein [Penicillium cinerascens]|uniref:C6 finger domain protein n=1 Tax=Penicillium cinerascens TaxID=70096 RepID=A0A9W9MIP6_9EURO|nr:C6 finger domain protein [Penicillium cinerascens]KAJ5202018.1 C6 finger domain protein [Penicillium cinerascens]
MLDLHAFIAAVLILLVSHSSPSTGRFNVHIDKVRIHTEVEQVINIMSERSDGTSESHFSQDGVTTLSFLNHHLQDENVAAVLELKLNVPLLGSVYVRRSAPQLANINSWPSQAPLDLGLLKPSLPSLLPTRHENNSVMTDQGGQEERRWDNISWSIEDNESFLQDFLMADDWGHFSM